MHTIDARTAKAVPLHDILDRYGYSPKRKSGDDLWYLSPFRDEKEPSFVVNTKKNLWYDHGEGKGGNVIDLVSRLSQETDVARVLSLVSTFVGGIIPRTESQTRRARATNTGTRTKAGTGTNDRTSASTNTSTQPTTKHTDTHTITHTGKSELLSEKELSHPALLRYLATRAIPREFARQYVREVRYRVEQNEYFAIGFPNESGGYEVRNAYFKGTIGTKDISILHSTTTTSETESTEQSGVRGTEDTRGSGTGTVVQVFEGFLDFLSWPALEGTGEHRETAIVLNSVALTDRAIAYLREHPPAEIRLFLDNDASGRATTERIAQAFPNTRIVDMSDRYREVIDVNQALIRLRDRKEELGRIIGQGRDRERERGS